MTNQATQKSALQVAGADVVGRLAGILLQRDLAALKMPTARGTVRAEPRARKIYLSAETHDRLRRISKQTGLSQAWILREAVSVLLENIEKQPENVDLLFP